MLKTACVRLDLPYDIDKHLFNAKGIRPKISYITHIYTCAGIVNIDDNNENKKIEQFKYLDTKNWHRILIGIDFKIFTNKYFQAAD